MKKIVIDARMIKSSGIGTYLQYMIPNLREDFSLILLGNKNEIYRFGWAKDLKVIDFNSPIYSLSEQFVLPFIVPACDIFLSPHYNIPVMPVKAKTRVVIIHDVYHLAFYGRLTGPQKLYAKVMINLAAKMSDRIITVSNFSKSEILKYINVHESKINVVYCGINRDEFPDTLNGNYSSIKEKYNLPENFFLFVSNIKPHKNLYNLLLAFKEVLAKHAKYKLVVVGEYKKLITADKDVFKLLDNEEVLRKNTVFTGYVLKDDLPGLYRSASALIFPSFYEGFGLPPIEAMICGCPVIASNAASIPEACGDAALYFKPGSVNDITEKLNLFISDPALKGELINKGMNNIKRFSRDVFSENIKNVLNSTD